MPLTTFEDFEDGTTDGWSGTISAQTAVVYAGTYAGEIPSGDAAERSIPTQVGPGTVEFAFRAPSGADPYIYLQQGSTQAVYIHFDGTDLEMYYNGQNNTVATGVSKDTWHYLGLDLDVDTDEVTEVRVDGSPAGTSPHPFRNSVSEVDTFRSFSGLYVDDMAAEVEAPAAPDAVQQDVEDDDTATATWEEDTSAGNPTEYEVEISTDGEAWTRVADLGDSARSHTETIARSVDTVQFRVRAVNSTGASDWAYTSTQSTNATGLQIDAVGATSIDLSWDDPTANDGVDVLLAEGSGSTAADYEVDQSLGADAASATVTELEHGERYYARVQATYDGADGTPAPVSNEADTVTDLPAPTVDGADASTLRALTLSLTIPDNSTDGDVLVERSTDGGATWGEHATIDDLSAETWTDTGLLDGEEYTYRLTRRTDHTETQSGTLAATTILPAPIGAEVTGTTADGISVAWTPVANAGTQRVEYRRSDVGGSPGAWTTGPSGLSTTADTATVSGLLDGEEYDVRIVAVTDHAEAVDESPGTKQPGEYGGSRYGYYQYGGTA